MWNPGVNSALKLTEESSPGEQRHLVDSGSMTGTGRRVAVAWRWRWRWQVGGDGSQCPRLALVTNTGWFLFAFFLAMLPGVPPLADTTRFQSG